MYHPPALSLDCLLIFPRYGIILGAEGRFSPRFTDQTTRSPSYKNGVLLETLSGFYFRHSHLTITTLHDCTNFTSKAPAMGVEIREYLS